MPWDFLSKLGLLIVLDLVLLCGLIAIPIGLGGNFILLGAALLVAIITRFQAITLVALIVMLVVVVLGEIIESMLGSYMAYKFGATRYGMIGAFVGGILGAVAGTPILPIIGSIAGSFIGAAIGAVLLEYYHQRKIDSSLPAGWGALLGKLASSVVKMCIGVGIAIHLVLATH
jgi:uncharacterized protein